MQVHTFINYKVEMKRIVFAIVSLIIVFTFNALGKSRAMYTRSYDLNDYLIRSVYKFSDIPQSILDNLDKMGDINTDKLNAYEVDYLNHIFNLNHVSFNLSDKRIAFIGGKKSFFSQERERYYSGIESGVECTVLYIFNDSQKKEVGGYDAAVYPWCKVIISTKKVTKLIKRNLL